MWKKSLIACHWASPSPSGTVYSDSSGSPSTGTHMGSESDSDHCALIADRRGRQADVLGYGSPSIDEEEDLDASEGGDSAEGVWSADIEQAFLEALAVYPPCGRRKIILSEEGRMFGRNELIARYIRLRTGKVRTRKQVSSHIQVLGRRQSKFITATNAFLNRKPYIQTQSSKERGSNPYVVPMSLQSPAKQSFDPFDLPEVPSPSTFATPTKNIPAAFQSPIGTPDSCRVLTPFHSLEQFFAMSPSGGGGGVGGIFQRPNAPGTPVFPEPIFSPAKARLGTPRSVGCSDETLLCSTRRPIQVHAFTNTQMPTETGCPSSVQKRMTMSLVQPTQIDCQSSTATETDECLPTDMTMPPAWQGRSAAGPNLRLVEMAAFLELKVFNEIHRHYFVRILDELTYEDPFLETIKIQHIQDKFPNRKAGLRDLFDRGPRSAFFLVKFWADLDLCVSEDLDAFYGTTHIFESGVNMTLQSSTKVCSFGRQVVEKVEKDFPTLENGRYVYRIQNSPMCDYMVNFIHKLSQLPEKSMMNSVLENFTALQVVTDFDSKETLLCIAYVFEVSTREGGPQHTIYHLFSD